MTETPSEGAASVYDEPIDPDKAGPPELLEMERRREDARLWLSLGLLSLLVGLALAYPICAAFVPAGRWPQVAPQLTGTFTAVVGLAGTAFGFYFSSRDGNPR